METAFAEYGLVAGGFEEAALEPAVPALLVLDPTMEGGPWSLAVARAAWTVQVHDVVQHLDELSVRVSLEYAVVTQSVLRVVVCGEGPGLPTGGVAESFFAKVRRFGDGVRSLEAAAARTLPVDALWHDTATGEIFAAVENGTRFVPVGEAPAESLLAALVQPPVSGATE